MELAFSSAQLCWMAPVGSPCLFMPSPRGEVEEGPLRFTGSVLNKVLPYNLHLPSTIMFYRPGMVTCSTASPPGAAYPQNTLMNPAWAMGISTSSITLLSSHCYPNPRSPPSFLYKFLLHPVFSPPCSWLCLSLSQVNVQVGILLSILCVFRCISCK